jgi:hypothetical protein
VLVGKKKMTRKLVENNLCNPLLDNLEL